MGKIIGPPYWELRLRDIAATPSAARKLRSILMQFPCGRLTGIGMNADKFFSKDTLKAMDNEHLSRAFEDCMWYSLSAEVRQYDAPYGTDFLVHVTFDQKLNRRVDDEPGTISHEENNRLIHLVGLDHIYTALYWRLSNPL